LSAAAFPNCTLPHSSPMLRTKQTGIALVLASITLGLSDPDAHSFRRAQAARLSTHFFARDEADKVTIRAQECTLDPQNPIYNPAKDLDLQCSMLHLRGRVQLPGRTVLIRALVANVAADTVIDVSGVHGRHAPAHPNNGKGLGAHGGNGAAGWAGGQAGNIVVHAGQIQGPQSTSFNIIANGGDGGNGQNGGNGFAGATGESKGGCACHGLVQGRPGQAGGNGGNGGAAGQGAAPGTAVLVLPPKTFMSNLSVQIVANQGVHGIPGVEGHGAHGGPGGTSGLRAGTCGFGRRRTRRRKNHCGPRMAPGAQGASGHAGHAGQHASDPPHTNLVGIFEAADIAAELPGSRAFSIEAWQSHLTLVSPPDRQLPVHVTPVEVGFGNQFFTRSLRACTSLSLAGRYDDAADICGVLCRLSSRNHTKPSNYGVAAQTLSACIQLEEMARGLDPFGRVPNYVSRLQISYLEEEFSRDHKHIQDLEKVVQEFLADTNNARKRQDATNLALIVVRERIQTCTVKQSEVNDNIHTLQMLITSLQQKLSEMWIAQLNGRQSCDDAVNREIARIRKKNSRRKKLKAVTIAVAAAIAMPLASAFMAAGSAAAGSAAGFSAKFGAFLSAGSKAVGGLEAVQKLRAGWKQLPGPVKDKLQGGGEELLGKLYDRYLRKQTLPPGLSTGPTAAQDVWDVIAEVVDRLPEQITDPVSAERAREEVSRQILLDYGAVVQQHFARILRFPECAEYRDSVMQVVNVTVEVNLAVQQLDAAQLIYEQLGQTVLTLEKQRQRIQTDAGVEFHLVDMDIHTEQLLDVFTGAVDKLVALCREALASYIGTYADVDLFQIDDEFVTSVALWFSDLMTKVRLKEVSQSSMRSSFSSYGVSAQDPIPIAPVEEISRDGLTQAIVYPDGSPEVEQIRNNGTATLHISPWHPVLARMPNFMASSIRVYVVGARTMDGYVTVKIKLSPYRPLIRPDGEEMVIVMDSVTALQGTYQQSSFESITAPSLPRHVRSLSPAGVLEISLLHNNYRLHFAENVAIAVVLEGMFQTCHGSACFKIHEGSVAYMSAMALPWAVGDWQECFWNDNACVEKRSVQCPARDSNFCKPVQPQDTRACSWICTTSTTTTSTKATTTSTTSTTSTTTITTTTTDATTTTTSTTSTTSTTTTTTITTSTTSTTTTTTSTTSTTTITTTTTDATTTTTSTTSTTSTTTTTTITTSTTSTTTTTTNKTTRITLSSASSAKATNQQIRPKPQINRLGNTTTSTMHDTQEGHDTQEALSCTSTMFTAISSTLILCMAFEALSTCWYRCHYYVTVL